MFDYPFCVMKPPTSNSSLNLLHSFLVILVFSPSAYHPFSFLSATLPSSSLRNIFNIFPILFRSIFLACTGSSVPAQDGIAHNPSTSCTKTGPLHLGQLSSPCHALPKMLCPHLFNLWLEFSRKHFGPSHFLASSCFCCFFRISYNDVCRTPLRPMLLCLPFC